MAIATAVPIEQRLAAMVAGICRLITAQEAWLVQLDLSVDIVLHPISEASRRAQKPGSFVHEAYSHGVLLDGQP